MIVYTEIKYICRLLPEGGHILNPYVEVEFTGQPGIKFMF